MRCQCLTTKGIQCLNNAVVGDLCRIHTKRCGSRMGTAPPPSRQNTQRPAQKRQTPIGQGPEVMDDLVLGKICQELADKGDYKGLANVIKTHKRGYRACQPILNQWIQSKEKENPEFVEIPDYKIDIKPEVVEPMWDWTLGDYVEWDEIINPDRIILWGKKPFTIRVPNFQKGEDAPHDEILDGTYDELIMEGPSVTIRQIVDAVNAYYLEKLDINSDITHWVGDHMYPEGLSRVDQYTYNLSLGS
jgi:hypothetical protein